MEDTFLITRQIQFKSVDQLADNSTLRKPSLLYHPKGDFLDTHSHQSDGVVGHCPDGFIRKCRYR